jgi:hypothetical protein
VTPRETVWRLRYDVLSGRLLLFLAQAEARGELRPDVHRFLAHRYDRLAAHWRSAGWARHAASLAVKSRRHVEAAGDDDPPPAVAVGMPRPRPSLGVDARGRVLDGRWGRRTPPSGSPHPSR